MIPALGRIVHYTLTESDAAAVNRRRGDAAKAQAHKQASGFAVHVGNYVRAGDVLPLVITRVSSQPDSVNGQVLLDGNDTLWVTSVVQGHGEGRWTAPPRV